MRARMNRQHRAARFGSHALYEGDVIFTEPEEGEAMRRDKHKHKVSMEEMLHHLEHSHADPLKGMPKPAKADELVEVEETAEAPKAPEKATPKPPASAFVLASERTTRSPVIGVATEPMLPLT